MPYHQFGDTAFLVNQINLYVFVGADLCVCPFNSEAVLYSDQLFINTKQGRHTVNCPYSV